MSRWFSLLAESSSLRSLASTSLTSADMAAPISARSAGGGPAPSRSCASKRSWRSCSFESSSCCFERASFSFVVSSRFSSAPRTTHSSSFLFSPLMCSTRFTRRSRSWVMSLTFWERYPVSPSRLATWPSRSTFSPSLMKISSSSSPFLKLASDTFSVSRPTSLAIMVRICLPCSTTRSAAVCCFSRSACSTLPAASLLCRPAFWPSSMEILCSSWDSAASREDTCPCSSSLY
mmetsp:Transcript_20163/g.53536  ORF Transcript_20163/g.53536 Transcript_20163/m.53536 type:complete len:233 (-) Transcript_20163:194-892(-)